MNGRRRINRVRNAGPIERIRCRCVTAVHLLFLGWTVFTAHYPSLFIGGFLFFLAFATATEHHQNPINLKPALLVGFFLAGLVVHGGLQGWWIAPVLRADERPLISRPGADRLQRQRGHHLSGVAGAGFRRSLKYAVVAGAVAGGGLTVIANAPNPPGQSILSRYFEDGVSAFGCWSARSSRPRS